MNLKYKTRKTNILIETYENYWKIYQKNCINVMKNQIQQQKNDINKLVVKLN